MRPSGGTSRKRPWLAALLALGYPGLGHLYLREWARALLWFGLTLLTASLLVPQSIVPETVSVASMRQAARAMPIEATLGLLVVGILNVADAYWFAVRNNREVTQTADGRRCPNCGEEIDEDIDFCHWCTTELEGAGGETPRAGEN
jgi:hypothetical protein